MDPERDDHPMEPSLDNECEVICPYCGEPVLVALDPGGGAVQDYVEDCQVCCQPWLVQVRYDTEGAAHLRLEQAQ